MIQLFKEVNIDWLASRRYFIFISLVLLLVGLASAVASQVAPGGREAFNLGIDFKGGTVVTVKFKQRPSAEVLRETLTRQGIRDAVIQPVTDKADEVLIRLPLQETGEGGEADQAQVDAGRSMIRDALLTMGPEGDAFTIVGTEQVGPIAGRQLRNQAVAVTMLALAGILLYIAFRFEWSYGAAAVIAVFHDVLITLGFFSIFQWEISLTVIAALLTLVGFSVNDTIVIFDRIRENLKLHRRESLYNITNLSINQTLSRTVITSGLVFCSVLALVLFGGDVLRAFSLALLIGVVFGTYSSVAIASPVMVWWQRRLDTSRGQPVSDARAGGPREIGTRKPSQAATGTGSSFVKTKQRAGRS